MFGAASLDVFAKTFPVPPWLTEAAAAAAACLFASAVASCKNHACVSDAVRQDELGTGANIGSADALLLVLDLLEAEEFFTVHFVELAVDVRDCALCTRNEAVRRGDK
jgi:hypothetical protein